MISQLRTNFVGAWWKAQVNQLISLTKHHAKVSCSAKSDEYFEDTVKSDSWHCFIHFQNCSSERDWTHQNLTKKEGNVTLSSLYADQFDCWLSVGSGEFELCLAEVGNLNCVKSFQWNTSLLSFSMVFLKVREFMGKWFERNNLQKFKCPARGEGGACWSFE